MATTAEIAQTLDALSDYEREHFLKLMRRCAGGERFWERGVAVLYEQYVKTRNASDLTAAGFDVTAKEGIFAPIPINRSRQGGANFPLPHPAPSPGDLTDLLAQRRSRREPSEAPMQAETLATLLHHACGITGTTRGYGYERLPLRTFPTCGGLQSPEIYVSAQTITGIEPGLFQYNVPAHALDLIRAGPHGAVLRALALDQPFVEQAAAVLIITGALDRLRWKYGERAYRYMYVDIGCVLQNLYLVGEALGLSVCALAGFVDIAVEQLLDIDGENEMAVLLVTIGVRCDS